MNLKFIYFSEDIYLRSSDKRLGYYLVQQAGSMAQAEEESESDSSSEDSDNDGGGDEGDE